MKVFMLIYLKFLTIANSFLINVAEHEHFSANKYENANYCCARVCVCMCFFCCCFIFVFFVCLFVVVVVFLLFFFCLVFHTEKSICKTFS